MTLPTVRQPHEGPPAIISTSQARTDQQWHNLPRVMTEYRQWALVGTSKAPLGIDRNGRLYNMSVTNPSQWMDFETVVREATACGLGFGFILSDNDPFTCVDLDVKDASTDPNKKELWTTKEDFDVYIRIYKSLDSFTERSRSGKGLHIWCEGNIGRGFKRGGVEIYSRERFIICTGDVLVDKPIMNRHAMLLNTVSQMRPVAKDYELEELPPEHDDWFIMEMGFEAANADKFIALFDGKWQALGYSSQSEADLSFMSMLTFYSQSNEQCRRIFRKSGLGQREKATKDNRYLDLTLKKCRSKQAKERSVDISALCQSHGISTHIPAVMRAYLTRHDVPLSEEFDLLTHRLVDWNDDTDAEVQDIVAGLVADEEVTLLGGHGGSGKSTLALELACSVATGSLAFGQKVVQNRVLYFSAEDGRKRLTRRIRALLASNEYDEQVLSRNLVVLDASDLPPIFGDTSVDGKSFSKVLGPTANYHALQSAIETFDPQLVIIDGASDAFDGNEIIRREVQAFIKALKQLHPSRTIGVLLLTHVDRASSRGNVTKDDGYSGSSAWHNSVRRRISLKPKAGVSVVLKVDKNQDAEPIPEIELFWDKSGRLALGSPSSAQTHRQDYSELFLKLIDERYQRGQFMSTSVAPQASTGVYASLKDDEQFPKELTRAATNAIVQSLVASGRLCSEEYQRPNRSKDSRWKVEK